MGCCYPCGCRCGCGCGCSCGCGYRHCLEIENATLVQGTSATIVTAPYDYVNRDYYSFRDCICFTDSTGAEVLQISNGTTTYPVWDENGEPVKIGRLRRCDVYTLRFSSVTTAHFTLEGCLPCLCIKTPELTASGGA